MAYVLTQRLAVTRMRSEAAGTAKVPFLEEEVWHGHYPGFEGVQSVCGPG